MKKITIQWNEENSSYEVTIQNKVIGAFAGYDMAVEYCQEIGATVQE